MITCISNPNTKHRHLQTFTTVMACFFCWRKCTYSYSFSKQTAAFVQWWSSCIPCFVYWVANTATYFRFPSQIHLMISKKPNNSAKLGNIRIITTWFWAPAFYWKTPSQCCSISCNEQLVFQFFSLLSLCGPKDKTFCTGVKVVGLSLSSKFQHGEAKFLLCFQLNTVSFTSCSKILERCCYNETLILEYRLSKL